MHIYILDDEEIFLNQLEGSIYEILPALDNSVIKLQSPEDFLNLLNSTDTAPDMIFLDIEMPGMDGMEVARNIRKTNKEVPIVFLTSHVELAMDGYEVNAFRFLAKPVDKSKLKKTLDDVIKNKKDNSIILRKAGEDIVIKTRDVLFVESDNNDIRVITTGGTYTVRKKISDFITEFNSVEDTLRKVHKSTAVNLFHVARIKEKDAILDTNQIVPISRNEYKNFKETLYDYVKKGAR